MIVAEAALGFGKAIIERIWPDPVKQAEAQLKLVELYQKGELEALANQSNIIVAEAKSEHFLTSTWRPITMLTFTAIIFNNYLFYPYMSAICGWGVITPIPPDMWSLLKLGIGGYVAGRTVEKVGEAAVPMVKDIVTAVKGKNK